ncbi:MAG: DHH family phosphoesterase [Clostridia bacterium]|nr:DHH family phosphoesterase [Clostridia bacterium]
MNDYEIFRNLDNNKSVCLISHISPDADALSSMIVLKDFLQQHFHFKNVDLFAQTIDSVDFYKPILEEETLNPLKNAYDIAIMLDAPNVERLGNLKHLFEDANIKIVIDHHATNNYCGNINIVEMCSSTCEIIYSILSHYNFNISQKNKGKLYAGIITDTNNFTVGNFNSRTFEVVSKLIDDIKKEDIYSYFLANNSIQQMSLLSKAVNNITFYDDNKIIISHVSLEDIINTNSSQNDCSCIINKLSTITGSKLVCFIYPTNNHEYYVSMRAKKDYDVSVIAKKFQGGGHTGAAAFLSTLPIDNIKEQVLQEFQNQLKTTVVTTERLF